MGGRAVGKNKKTYTVKRFKHEWLNEVIDGVTVKTWLVADPTDSSRGKCLVCPARNGSVNSSCRTFSIAEGVTAIRQHWKSQIHTKSKEEPEKQYEDQMGIEASLRNQKELSAKNIREKKLILEGQIKFSNMIHHHGASSSLFTCFAKSAHEIFPDSSIAKQWGSGKSGFRATKGDYFCTFGIYPYQLEKLVKILRNNHFSINFDETSINGENQLSINVSYFLDGDMFKENLTTINMKNGTTAEEIVEATLGKLEEYLIPLENIIFVSKIALYL